MIGWVMLVIVALAAGLLLALLRFPRRLWTVAATALTLGATGYAWQGNPGLPGHPAATIKRGAVDPGMVVLREAMFGRFDQTWGYFNNADNSLRAGEPAYAVAWMRSAANKAPNDPAAWAGLGMMLAEHDQGVSPAARLAFDKAMALSPKHPGPPFFLGAAYARMGAVADARRWWAKSLEVAPPDAPYRDALKSLLARADERLAAPQAQ